MGANGGAEAAIIGAGVSLGGQAIQQQANDAQMTMNAEEYRIASIGEEQAATDTLQRGATAASLARMKGSQTAAKQGVAYAASGVDQSTGTAAAVQTSTNALGEYDALIASNNATREALGHKAMAGQLSRKAVREIQNRYAARTAADIKAGTTMLEAAGSAAGQSK